MIEGRNLESSRKTEDDHDKIHNTKSERRKSKLRLEYKMKDREVERRGERGQRGLHKKVHRECGNNQRAVPSSQINYKKEAA